MSNQLIVIEIVCYKTAQEISMLIKFVVILTKCLQKNSTSSTAVRYVVSSSTFLRRTINFFFRDKNYFQSHLQSQYHFERVVKYIFTIFNDTLKLSLLEFQNAHTANICYSSLYRLWPASGNTETYS